MQASNLEHPDNSMNFIRIMRHRILKGHPNDRADSGRKCDTPWYRPHQPTAIRSCSIAGRKNGTPYSPWSTPGPMWTKSSEWVDHLRSRSSHNSR
jgi:hypothetical protein